MRWSAGVCSPTLTNRSGCPYGRGARSTPYTTVNIAPDAAALYDKGELIVKVKEPIAGDLALLRKDHLLFCYLHLAAEPALTKRLLDIGLTGVAFETVELDNCDLPLLAPMSVIAGKIGVQVGTHLLHQPEGGKGKLLGGLAATDTPKHGRRRPDYVRVKAVQARVSRDQGQMPRPRRTRTSWPT